MPETSDAAREAFLAETRICVFTTFGKSGWPNSVPVWFEWDGSKARMFSYNGTIKLRNLERDPRATLLVFNHLEDPEYWVRIEGTVEILTEGAVDLAKRLADRYWDMSQADHQKILEFWVSAGAAFRVLELTPDRIRAYEG